ncbi:hypothetical protein A3844_20835 [Paenibacillus helianthi]|uniref:Uncharacterized protein n=1 Tax=Paenibacillus helianthi TaxID=1349432 RepID=A0ABX3EM18_9BACL|nr:hypothetical protein A3844_20835 [Paenibacillus helianthi]
MQLRCDWYAPDTFHLAFYQPLMRIYNLLLNIHSVQKELLRLLKMNICDFVIKAIYNDSYIYVLINKRFIPNYKTIENLMHDLLIFGYDKEVIAQHRLLLKK